MTRGENNGRTLRHSNVGRYFNSLPLSHQYIETTFDIAPQWKKQDLSVIVYVQDAKSMQILGAQDINFPDN